LHEGADVAAGSPIRAVVVGAASLPTVDVRIGAIPPGYTPSPGGGTAL